MVLAWQLELNLDLKTGSTMSSTLGRQNNGPEKYPCLDLCDL